MKKVRTMQEAYRVFEYLGIKDVTKPWQKRKGNEVWELPQKTIFYNGHSEINRFTIYKNGYIRKMVVNSETNGSRSCWQLNRVRKLANFVKDYKWDDGENNMIWTGKYRKIYNNERIMIDTHQERVVYLCNYILKNYYNKSEYALVGGYTQEKVKETHGDWWRSQRKQDDLPFFDGDEHDLVRSFEKTVERDGFIDDNDIQVIINGHRYNLS